MKDLELLFIILGCFLLFATVVVWLYDKCIKKRERYISSNMRELESNIGRKRIVINLIQYKLVHICDNHRCGNEREIRKKYDFVFNVNNNRSKSFEAKIEDVQTYEMRAENNLTRNVLTKHIPCNTIINVPNANKLYYVNVRLE